VSSSAPTLTAEHLAECGVHGRSMGGCPSEQRRRRSGQIAAFLGGFFAHHIALNPDLCLRAAQRDDSLSRLKRPPTGL